MQPISFLGERGGMLASKPPRMSQKGVSPLRVFQLHLTIASFQMVSLLLNDTQDSCGYPEVFNLPIAFNKINDLSGYLHASTASRSKVP